MNNHTNFGYYFLKTVLFSISIYLYSYKCFYLFLKCKKALIKVIFYIIAVYDSHVTPPANLYSNLRRTMDRMLSIA